MITVIYYTSNQEDEKFEGKIRRSLRHSSKPLPIISVSQKPIDFGENICVGDVGVSSQNAWRQLQIGAIAAKTKYVCTAEADCIYPKEYFRFVPPKDDVAYIAKPLYVVFNQRGKARVFCYKPRGSESAMVINRECLINGLKESLAGWGKWGQNSANGETIKYLLDVIGKREYFSINYPVLTFKTDRNMHRRTPYDSSTKTRDLEPFGNTMDLINRYFK